MAKIKINDISMYYEIHGKGEPIVFIGGFSSDHLVWNALLNQFAEKYQVILFDNRGVGQTDAPSKAYTIEKMAQDIAELCSALRIQAAHFVGNSMGGFILQTLAFRYPKLIKSAILSNSAATIHSPFNIYLAAQLELLRANAPLKALIKASCSWVFSYQFLSKPGVLDQITQMSLENPYPFTIQGYQGQYAALEQFDSRSWAHKIKVPTLVMASDQDLIFNVSAVKWLAQHIPYAKYHCFSQCGHLPQIECPEEFSKIVQDFISSCLD